MNPETEGTESCGSCGAVIYPEMIANNAAGHWDGALLCPHCLNEKKQEALARRSAAPTTEPEDNLAPISLVSAEGADVVSERPSTAKQAFGGGITFDRPRDDQTQYKRALLKNTSSATRCRTFHCKLNDPSIHNMNQQINEWIDDHEDYEIKFVCSDIGVMEGKHADPHLIVTVFY